MKRAIIALLIAAMLTTGVALAEEETYTDRNGDFSFKYDPALFEIEVEDYASKEDDADAVVILTGKEPAWGETTIEIFESDAYTQEEIDELETALETTMETGEWNGFKNVMMYSYQIDDISGQAFVIPCEDDDALTASVSTGAVADEAVRQNRDDAISAVLDSLKILDD